MNHITSTYQRFVISREQEQKWAAEHSHMTRILGWCMISVFVFQIISAVFTDWANIDILLLVGGHFVLQGSQAWIRSYLVVGVMACVAHLIMVGEAYLHREPLISNNTWVDHRDLAFWQEYVLPMGIYLGFALFCLATLKSRQLVFWTRTCKRWVSIFAGIIGLMYLISIITASLEYSPRKEMRQQHAAALTIVRDYARTHGSSHLSASIIAIKKTLAKDSSIQWAGIHYSPNSLMTLYDRNEKVSAPYDSDYNEFIKGPSGEWLKISIQFNEP